MNQQHNTSQDKNFDTSKNVKNSEIHSNQLGSKKMQSQTGITNARESEIDQNDWGQKEQGNRQNREGLVNDPQAKRSFNNVESDVEDDESDLALNSQLDRNSIKQDQPLANREGRSPTVGNSQFRS